VRFVHVSANAAIRIGKVFARLVFRSHPGILHAKSFQRITLFKRFPL
jgi:hypothetical protein